MEILPATLRDLGSLRRLEQACFPKDAWPLLDLIAVLTWPDIVRLKAVQDGRMIGFVAGDPRRSEAAAWIATIAVQPDWQRRGVGRALLRECERQLGMPRIRLCVRTENAAAIRLYEAEGYARADIWRQYYNDGGDALVMDKNRTTS